MPTYTYRCQRCGEEFERFQSMSDEPVKRCPMCKGKVQRTFHPVGIVLKGSGFHKTDYRSPARKKAESSESKSSEPKSSESESKSSGSKDTGGKDPGSQGSQSSGAKPASSKD